MLIVTHPGAVSRAPRVLTRLIHMRQAPAWTLVLLCVDLAVLGDLATGPALWFGPVYLLVICFAAWSLGWRASQATGVGCMALSFAINGISLYPYGSVDLVWNFAMRFAAISVVIAVVAGARHAYIREWWLARTDVLTGALNRQAFFELAEEATSSLNWRLLAYVDIDGFKQINDHDGHPAGDACLKDFVATVRTMIRRGDVFARIGGDEFLVFMTVRDEVAAAAVAKRLHAQMNRIARRGGTCLRCSVGALAVAPGERSIDELVRLADNLMYGAKQEGAGLKRAVAPQIAEAMPLGRARGASRKAASMPAGNPSGRADRRAPLSA